jgi:hypothetical protein
VSVPVLDIVEITGADRVGPVANTRAPPEPVSSVTAVLRLAEEGVVRKVAMPAAIPDKLAGVYPVQLVRVPLAGVPKTGAVIVGAVRVLLVRVSVVLRPTSVSTTVGIVAVLTVVNVGLVIVATVAGLEPVIFMLVPATREEDSEVQPTA